MLRRALHVLDQRLHVRETAPLDMNMARVSAGAVAIVGLFMTTVAVRMFGPTIHPDEFGFLINGQVLIGREEAPIPTGSFYPAGYGLVTGIAHLVTGSMEGAYRFSLLANVVLAAATAVMAQRLARKGFGCSVPVSLVAGALVFAVPGTILAAMFSWAETAARLMFLVFCGLLLRAARSKSIGDVTTLGLFVGLMPALHGRFTLLVPVVIALVALWVVQKSVTKGMFATHLIAAVSGYAVSYGMNTFIKRAVYTTSYDQENRLLERLVDVTLWPALLRTMTGQTWYLLATTFGLFGVAVVFVVVRALSSVRSDGGLRDPEATAMLAMLVGTMAVVFTGGLQLLYGDRGDHLIYGRYVEMMVPAFLVLSCVAFERSFRTAHRALLGAGIAVLGIAAVYVAVDGGDGVKYGHFKGNVVFPNIIGTDVAQYIVPVGLVPFALLFGAVIAVLWLCFRWIGAWALVVAVVLFGAGSMYSGDQSLLPRTELLEVTGTSVDYVLASGGDTFGFDKGVRNDRAYYYMRYLLHPLHVEMMDLSAPGSVIRPEIRCAFGWADRPPVDGQWRIVAEETPLGRVLWQRVEVASC